jgi:CRISPR-associated protein Csc3
MSEYEDNNEFEDNIDDLPLEPLELPINHNQDEDKAPESKLLTVSLFQKAIVEAEGNQEDLVLKDFANQVLPKLIHILTGATAKGGQFTENRRAEGKNVERSKHDQSFISHLLNGLFPTYRIVKQLKSPDLETNRVKRHCSDIETRIFIASYILHDFDKFPDFPNWLVDNSDGKYQDRNWQQNPPHKSDALNFGRNFVKLKCQELGLDKFLGNDWDLHIDDIVWLSHNAGEKYDADKGMESRGLQPKLDGRVRGVLQNLVRISDLFASVIKHPRDVESNGQSDGLPELLNDLSNGQLQFIYHSLSDNRGVLTNILNNALIDGHVKANCTPLLYLPDGVVYLTISQKSTIQPQSIINTDDIPNLVVDKIKKLCTRQLIKRQMGFSRDGKGFKFAEYYWLFFSVDELMKVCIDAARKILPDTKPASSGKRSDSLLAFQTDGELSSDLNLVFGNEIKIDRLAEFGDIICRGVWDKWCQRANDYQKLLPKNQRQVIPDFNLTLKLVEYLGLVEEIPALRQIQALKKTGGVPLDWYYLAAKYFQKNPGLDLQQNLEVMEGMVNFASSQIKPHLEKFNILDGWGDLKTYVSRVISLPSGAVVEPSPDNFLVELNRYNAAKITNGRGRENVCAMSSSAYTVTEQMESATLFAPQVYSNRQILFNTQAAKRQICSIWSIELMLRQILMSKTNATGGDFEGRKFRYLYLYPAYFFTPETNKFLQKAYNAISQTRFDAEMRKHFINQDQVANLDISSYQRVDDLLIKSKQPEDDRTFKISYPDDETLTFFFIGLPPGREATDTESWIMPAWLALALPLLMDVKVVASESPVPPFISGADFEKTTLLDGEHQAIRSLIKHDNYRLDGILPRQVDGSSNSFSPLNSLTAAYCIHLEVNRKKDGDPDWGKLADLSRDLETSPLYVFHYLNKWLRKQDKLESVPVAKIRLYFQFYKCFEPEGKSVNQLRELTTLYRLFYRAKNAYAKANAILKPIDEAADVILKVDKALANDRESLIDVVAARLSKLMGNVRRRAAEGKPALTLVDGKWKPALSSEEERQAVYEFAKYFVETIFEGSFKGDRARLAGAQLNLIRDTCEYLYRIAEDEERRLLPQNQPDDIQDVEAEEAA